MKILHTESSLGWGGQENRTLNELIGLRALGYQPLLACPPNARLGARAREAGFEVIDIAMRGALDLPALWQLRHLMASRRIDIVNTHSGRDTQLAGMAARTLGRQRPRIVRTRHLALPISSLFSYVTLPDHVVTVSRFVASYLASVKVPAEHITAVPTGIDLGRYQTTTPGSLRKELGLADDTPLIGTVAILRRKKGHAELIEAIPTVLEKFPTAHFVFAGDGPQTNNLNQRITELGLTRNVHLLGLRRDVVNVLASLDLFVLPTHQEALGTAFIEAAAMGVPAIACRVDGVPEVVCDGKSGLLVPVDDSAAIAASIIRLLSDNPLRQSMGIAARQWAEAHYSREVMVEGMLAVYQKLLAAKS
ncbi:MAG: glycosyltransferase family 1 protein [Rugosibacter sp.]|nr:MAG: glycosyltransferase family 1 protein [Rugosibacter sp.]TBR11863.1 MAG: glycosyltransferase family 1 protein [Rugosibacter sp.]